MVSAIRMQLRKLTTIIIIAQTLKSFGLINTRDTGLGKWMDNLYQKQYL